VRGAKRFSAIVCFFFIDRLKMEPHVHVAKLKRTQGAFGKRNPKLRLPDRQDDASGSPFISLASLLRVRKSSGSIESAREMIGES